jgi:hypothetical protein
MINTAYRSPRSRNGPDLIFQFLVWCCHGYQDGTGGPGSQGVDPSHVLTIVNLTVLPEG